MESLRRFFLRTLEFFRSFRMHSAEIPSLQIGRAAADFFRGSENSNGEHTKPCLIICQWIKSQKRMHLRREGQRPASSVLAFLDRVRVHENDIGYRGRRRKARDHIACSHTCKCSVEHSGNYVSFWVEGFLTMTANHFELVIAIWRDLLWREQLLGVT